MPRVADFGEYGGVGQWWKWQEIADFCRSVGVFGLGFRRKFEYRLVRHNAVKYLVNNNHVAINSFIGGLFNMSLRKPFLRIMRPMLSGRDFLFHEYILDNRYANDTSLLCRSYELIINDLKRLFEFIEPSDDNLKTYSHRTFELLLRAATEFETNCKRILEANGYSKSGNLNILDYYKINSSSKLSEYKVILEIWRPDRKEIHPFANWNSGTHELKWYKAYNNAKHDRHLNFSDASLHSVLEAIAGLFVILFSQFGINTFNPYQVVDTYTGDDDGAIFTNESIFRIKIPETWTSDELYDFDWKTLKKQSDPFDQFCF